MDHNDHGGDLGERTSGRNGGISVLLIDETGDHGYVLSGPKGQRSSRKQIITITETCVPGN